MYQSYSLPLSKALFYLQNLPRLPPPLALQDQLYTQNTICIAMHLLMLFCFKAHIYCEAPLACDWNTELHFGDANNPTQKNGNRSFWYKILWTTFWWSLTSGRSEKVEYHISEVKSYIIMFLNRSKMDTFYMYEIQSASSKQTK